MAYTTTEKPTHLWWANDFKTQEVPDSSLWIRNSGLSGSSSAYCILVQLDLEQYNPLLRGGALMQLTHQV